jgi:hypothetical protein
MRDVQAADPKPSRTVRLPFDFGQTVYHRSKPDKLAGMVTGYTICPGATMVSVTWGDDLRQFSHYFFELTTEFEPEIT